ncbi:Gx transporter family protein [Thiospirochaeta perfilievii]|nr:Gx transporter family protein [Thiospirochaeta perfilievii]
MKSMPSRSNSYNIIPILGALSLFFSVIEYIIPKPIPFLRIGLANIPILLSLVLLTPKKTILLIFIKSIGSSLIAGTIFSWIFLYSLSGSLASGIIMLIFYRVFNRWISMIGISVIGALSSNLVQISFATLLLGSGAKYIGLPILITGLITGIVIGYFTNNFLDKSLWIRSNKLNIQ